MDTGGERKTTAEEVEWADPGAALKLRGCEPRWAVDLGSAHDDGWSRSRYRSLIGQIGGVNPTSFLLGRTAWAGRRRTSKETRLLAAECDGVRSAAAPGFGR